MNICDEFVIGDEEKIEIVIRNLYINALKYSNENEEIKISLHAENMECICIIENSGVKIEEIELTNIWNPFYRIEKSRNRDFGGTGLGLYIVKQILDKHNSKYGIENTSFGVKAYFILPIISCDDN